MNQRKKLNWLSWPSGKIQIIIAFNYVGLRLCCEDKSSSKLEFDLCESGESSKFELESSNIERIQTLPDSTTDTVQIIEVESSETVDESNLLESSSKSRSGSLNGGYHESTNASPEEYLSNVIDDLCSAQSDKFQFEEELIINFMNDNAINIFLRKVLFKSFTYYM